MRRWVLAWVLGWLWSAGAARAQPAPSDEAARPFVEAAEEALAEGDAARARAQTDLALEHLLPDSALSARVVALTHRLPPSDGGPLPDASRAVPPLGSPNRLSARRSDFEMIYLYSASGVFGGYTGFAISLAARFGAGGAEDSARVYAGTTLAGTGLFLLGAFALDQAPLLLGVPTTLAVGLEQGVLIGLLGGSMIPFAEPRFSGEWVPLLSVGTGAIGAAVGFGVGVGLRPHPSEARFVESGMFIGSLAGLSLGALMEPDGNGVDDALVVLGSSLSGLVLGSATALFFAARGEHMSLERSALVNLGAVVGGGVGVGAGALIAGRGLNTHVAGGAAFAGIAVGVVVAAIASQDVGGNTQFDTPPMAFGITPIEGGGAMVSLGGSLR